MKHVRHPAFAFLALAAFTAGCASFGDRPAGGGVYLVGVAGGG